MIIKFFNLKNLIILIYYYNTSLAYFLEFSTFFLLTNDIFSRQTTILLLDVFLQGVT